MKDDETRDHLRRDVLREHINDENPRSDRDESSCVVESSSMVRERRKGELRSEEGREGSSSSLESPLFPRHLETDDPKARPTNSHGR